jgi:hypothetical protein
LLAVIGIAWISLRPRPTPRAAEDQYIPPFRPGIAEITKPTEPSIAIPVEEPRPLPTQLASHQPGRHGNLARRSNSTDSRAKDELVADNDSTIAANYEIATDFMPVGYASPLSLEDGGQVMRVELPRSALAGFGLPVNMDRVNERVKADVLVGTDGQAKAIRFVQ